MRKLGRSAILWVIAVAWSSAGCGVREPGRPAFPLVRADASVVRIGVAEGRGVRVVRLPLEEYVTGAALAEVAVGSLPPPAAARALDVQVLLARTYAVANRGRHAREGFDLCATTHCQLYRPPAAYPARLREAASGAAARTEGRLILYAGKPIQALYHSDCGGHTSAAADVWQGPSQPYLRPVADTFCVRPASAWQWRVRAADLQRALGSDPSLQRGGRLNRLSILHRDVAGRVDRIAFGTGAAPVRAADLRARVLERFGPRSLRSTRFTVERQGDWFVFDGRGNGHGAGLCQVGAIARAAAGQSALEILGHYFRGVRLGPAPAGSAPPARKAGPKPADWTRPDA